MSLLFSGRRNYIIIFRKPVENLSKSKKKIFVDGKEGTTGLEINQRLEKIAGVEIITIAESKKKELAEKIKCYDQADLVVLCLPDEASRQAVKAIKKAKILDCSTAFRTHPGWVYGFAELKNNREKIKQAMKVSNPGCYALAFIALFRPLVELRLLPADFIPSVWGISGYTGGGKKMIENYENKNNSLSASPFLPFLPYGLHLNHKHLQEMKMVSGLKNNPIFLPSVIAIPRGLFIISSLNKQILTKNNLTAEKILEELKLYYESEKDINVLALKNEILINEKFLDIRKNNHTNKLDIIISNNKNESVLLIARIDNLGKGASLNAVENLKLMLNL